MTEDRIARAKMVRCEEYLSSRGWRGRRQGGHIVGPCPVCGQGDDRFFISNHNNVWGLRLCQHGTRSGGDVIDLVEMIAGVDRREALERLVGAREAGGRARDGTTAHVVSATHSERNVAVTRTTDKTVGEIAWSRGIPFEYRDAQNVLLYRNVRYPLVGPDGSPVLSRKGKPAKEFRQEHYDWAERKWKPGRPCPPIPYRLAELLLARRLVPDEPIYVVEGEAKVDALRDWELTATSFQKGCEKLDELLVGADVVLVPDKDDAGARYATWIAKAIRNSAKSVKLLELPGLKASGDIIDWIADGGGKKEFLILAADARSYPFETERSPVPINGQPSEWLDRCLKGSNGNVLPILANALIGLRYGYPKRYTYDEMLRVTIAAERGLPISDVDVSIMQEEIQLRGIRRMARNNVQDAIAVVASENSFHPVREYLERLKWDGVERIGRFFTRYIGALDTDYERQIGRMFLISMVARILKPGCKVDHVPVIEGPQGALKSTACKILAGDYFSDNLPDVSNKDSSQHLRGKWLIEIAEMHAFGLAAVAALKSFISRTDERYFARYARNEVHEPRQCVFIGTTNQDSYLRDETGGRRFWPVKAGVIDIEALKRDRDQLFAEAVLQYLNNEIWWPDKDFEQKYIKPQQDRRFEMDEWLVPVIDYLNSMITDHATIYAIARSALDIPAGRISATDTRRIRSILVRLRWEKGKQDAHGRVKWHRPKEGGVAQQNFSDGENPPF